MKIRNQDQLKTCMQTIDGYLSSWQKRRKRFMEFFMTAI
jgi:hypothetical protein